MAVDGGGNRDRDEEGYRTSSKAADRPGREGHGISNGEVSAGDRGSSISEDTGGRLANQLHQQPQLGNSDKLFPSHSNGSSTNSGSGSNSFKTEQLTNRDDEDQYIDYYYNNRPWWEHATGKGASGPRGNGDLFPQRKHHSDPTGAEAGPSGLYSGSDKSLKHLLTKSNAENHVASSYPSAGSAASRGLNRFKTSQSLSQSTVWDDFSPHESHRSLSRTLAREKREDYLKDYHSAAAIQQDNPDYPESNGLLSDSVNSGVTSGSSEIHTKSNAHYGQNQQGSSPFTDFISNWTSTSNSSESSRLSHDLSTLSHDLTSTATNNNTTASVYTSQEFNSTSFYGASSTFYNNGSSGNQTESLLVDSSYELSTEFPGYISPQNISFDGSLPLALEHMFSNYSGSACGEWNASYPLCYSGTSLNTTANASLGEPGDADATPRYWALFLLLFPIFTVSRRNSSNTSGVFISVSTSEAQISTSNQFNKYYLAMVFLFHRLSAATPAKDFDLFTHRRLSTMIWSI